MLAAPSSATLTAVGLLIGMFAIISAAGGVLLVIRAVRSKERAASVTERNQLTALLTAEREAHLIAEIRLHQARLLLAEHGIETQVMLATEEPGAAEDLSKEAKAMVQQSIVATIAIATGKAIAP